ncbi:MAG: MBL fold metallo-hydrolase, partial [bacterium]
MNFIKFLGTAGARIVVSKQLRQSGGIWFHFDGIDVLVDPGPGSLIRVLNSKPKLDPTSLNAIILSHKHLDHSNDVNIMIEAMTEGGFNQKGYILAPTDAFEKDGVILKYARNYVKKEIFLVPETDYEIDGVKFSTSIQHQHGDVETLGIKFKTSKYIISYLSDTFFFPEILNSYQGTDILIINTVLHLPSSRLNHLCIDDVRKIITHIKPHKVILTHLGMAMLEANPEKIAKE